MRITQEQGLYIFILNMIVLALLSGFLLWVQNPSSFGASEEDNIRSYKELMIYVAKGK